MNNYFQFKQFIIHQDKCAMKVTEMACIQGAWTKIPTSAKTVLDIGCGTGLLSLMLAQKYPNIKIDAIEIEEECFIQAKENIENSVFKHQISCIHEDVLQYRPNFEYDFIIVNPPFFENDLKSNNNQKNLAWHSVALPLEKLIDSINRLLQSNGKFCVMMPSDRKAALLEIAADKGFFAGEILQIQHATGHKIHNEVFVFSKVKTNLLSQLLLIKEDKVYTVQFVDLLKEYYLKM